MKTPHRLTYFGMFFGSVFLMHSTPICSRAAEFVAIAEGQDDIVDSAVFGVAANGMTVVGAFTTRARDGVFEAFRWTDAIGLYGLGALDSGPRFGSDAMAISQDGTVVVGSSRSPRSAGALEAFRWTEGDGIVGLGGLVEVKGQVSSSANDVSADGRIIVGGSLARFESNGAEYEAFRWTEADGMQALGDLPGGDVRGAAQAISADGLVIVGSSESERGREAFRWTKQSGMVALGALGDQRFDSFATDVSADGSVVVGVSDTDDMGPRAFRWTKNTGMVALDATEFRGSSASGVSADGSVIVGGATVNDVESAFIWTETDGMLILQDWLVDEFNLGADVEGWTLTRANAISANGRAIVGEGTNPAGNREGWLVRLDPVPEPATAATAILAACMTPVAFRRIGRR